jgi:integrase/recombinase XerC
MNHIAPLPSSALLISALVVTAGDHAQTRFREFFAANIRNRHTRRAYAQAVREFLAWCERAGVTSITDVQPLHVAAYIEQLGRERSAPTVKQRLAAIKHLFDWLVTGQVTSVNPASSVRGPPHSVKRGQDARARSIRSTRVAREHRRDDADWASRPRPDWPHGLFVRSYRCGGRDEG